MLISFISFISLLVSVPACMSQIKQECFLGVEFIRGKLETQPEVNRQADKH